MTTNHCYQTPCICTAQRQCLRVSFCWAKPWLGWGRAKERAPSCWHTAGTANMVVIIYCCSPIMSWLHIFKCLFYLKPSLVVRHRPCSDNFQYTCQTSDSPFTWRNWDRGKQGARRWRAMGLDAMPYIFIKPLHSQSPSGAMFYLLICLYKHWLISKEIIKYICDIGNIFCSLLSSRGDTYDSGLHLR